MAMTDTTEIQRGPEHGSNEDARQRTEGRHPGVRNALLWLTFRHLPPQLQGFSRPFYDLAAGLIIDITTDSPELTNALNKIIEAKDSAVRAGIFHQQGQAGSVPRPQTVVDPPQFGDKPPAQTLVSRGGIVPEEKFGRPGKPEPTGAEAEAQRMRDRLPDQD